MGFKQSSMMSVLPMESSKTSATKASVLFRPPVSRFGNPSQHRTSTNKRPSCPLPVSIQWFDSLIFSAFNCSSVNHVVASSRFGSGPGRTLYCLISFVPFLTTRDWRRKYETRFDAPPLISSFSPSRCLDPPNFFLEAWYSSKN